MPEEFSSILHDQDLFSNPSQLTSKEILSRSVSSTFALSPSLTLHFLQSGELRALEQVPPTRRADDLARRGAPAAPRPTTRLERASSREPRARIPAGEPEPAPDEQRAPDLVLDLRAERGTAPAAAAAARAREPEVAELPRTWARGVRPAAEPRVPEAARAESEAGERRTAEAAAAGRGAPMTRRPAAPSSSSYSLSSSSRQHPLPPSVCLPTSCASVAPPVLLPS